MSTVQVVQQIAAAVTANPLANPQHATANLANAVTAIYGLSGSGKSSLLDTAVEYCWQHFQKIAMIYAADLGGFGSKRLALIRAGLAIVYDPRNHIDPFATMEACSHGAIPAYLLPGGGATADERERGYAPPDCELIMPHRKRYTIQSANGEQIAQGYDIPTAQTLVQQHAGSQLLTEIVQSHGFERIGMYGYDSGTALNEWGMTDLQAQSAAGLLPSGGSGGSALGSADALRSGAYVFGTSSKAMFGFLQQRSYGWIANIRSIPNQVVPPVMTFMVEMSKGDDESGGQPVFGPKIAGNARTSSVPGWVGNCTHATREPGADGLMHYRLWLVNHVDPKDPRGVPYLAKQRGTPLDMPEYLEDQPGEAPWTTCSLGYLYAKLDSQVVAIEAQLRAKFPNTPGLPMTASAAPEVVMRSVASAPMPVGALGLRPSTVAPLPGAQPTPSLPAKRGLRVSAGAPPAPVLLSPAPPPAPSAPGATGAATTAPTAPQPIVAAATDAPVGGLAVVPVPATAMPPAGAPLQPATPVVANTSATPRLATRSRVPRPPV